MKRPKVVGFVQARMSSTRLPGKVMMDLCDGKPMVWHAYQRLKHSSHLDQTAILTSINPADNPVAEMATRENIPCIRGDESDLLNRYMTGAKQLGADIIIRVTSDCPLADPQLVDTVIDYYLKHPDLDYISNSRPKATYPHGLDVELFTFRILEQAWREVTDPFRREWLTTNFFEHPEKYHNHNILADSDYRKYRLTVDYAEDMELLRKIFAHFYPKNKIFGWKDVVLFLEANPNLLAINARHHGDEGYRNELQKRGLL